MLNKTKYNEFMNRVGKKLSYMQGKMVSPWRNEESVRIHTIGRILQACKNLYFSSSGDIYDPVESVYRGFSVGYGDVAGLEARGVEDITILGAILSIVPYLSIERSMDAPEQSITYQVLKAMNSVGGLTAGDIARSPFAPHNLNINLELRTVSSVLTVGASGTASFGAPIVKGGVLVKIQGDGTNTVGTLEGKDLNKDGVIHWIYTSKPSGTLVSIPDSVAIDYDAGTVTVTPVQDKATTTVYATIDGTADSDGSGILRVKPSFETTILKATPNNVILESSLESEAYRNKMLQNAIDAGMTIDMGEIAFRQLLEMYVDYINYRVAASTISAGELAKTTHQGGNYIEIDVSAYDNGNYTQFSSTKDDRINKFILSANAHLMKISDRGATAILVGIEGANQLANVAGRFVEGPNFGTTADGFVGTYNNIPVIRHRAVDLASESKYANIYLVHKTPDGKAAPTAFGEYLPLYSTKQVLNFNNPTQFAQALFGYVGTKTIVPNLVTAARIKYSS